MTSKGYNSYRGRTPLWRVLVVIFLILVILAAGAFLFLQHYLVYDDTGQARLELPWRQEASGEPDGENPPAEDEVQLVIREPENPGEKTVAGVLLSGGADTWQTAVDALDAADRNMFAVTMKETGGRLLYPSTVEAAERAGAISSDARANAVLAALLGQGHYSVARLSCLLDPLAARADVEGMGLKNTGGYLFYDGRNTNWLDPSKAGTQAYLSALVTECAAMGFDEILLTDLSFPTEGKLHKIAYPAGGMQASLRALLTALRSALDEGGHEDVALSVELPAAVLTEGSDETSGLALADLAPLVDRVYGAVDEAAAAAVEESLPETVDLVLEAAVPPEEERSYLLIP